MSTETNTMTNNDATEGVVKSRKKRAREKNDLSRLASHPANESDFSFSVSKSVEFVDSSVTPLRKSMRSVKFRIPRGIRTFFFQDTCKLPNAFLLCRNPNIFKISNFLSKDQLTFFDEYCRKNIGRFEKSFTQDEFGAEVISNERTSRYLWFGKQQNRYISLIEKKAADTVGLSIEHVEPLQLVSYTKGQRFNDHHDAGTVVGDGAIEVAFPLRLVTFFVYLNDLPVGEGHTVFPKLNLSIQPERGTALVFCNINEDGVCIPETIHRAEPVTSECRKFGLNIWLTS